MNRQERAERWVRAGPVKMARRLVELEDMIIEGMYEQLEKVADEAFKTMFQTGPATEPVNMRSFWSPDPQDDETVVAQPEEYGKEITIVGAGDMRLTALFVPIGTSLNWRNEHGANVHNVWIKSVTR